MLERTGENAFDYVLHDGAAPTRIQWHFFEQLGLPAAIQTGELPPGGSEGMHAPPESDSPLEEFYLVLDGAARITIDGETLLLGRGGSALAPVGAQHDVVHAGREPLRLLTVCGPTGAADFSGFGSAAAAGAARAATSDRG